MVDVQQPFTGYLARDAAELEDIAADAKEINEQRQAEYDAQQIEDAKALLASAEAETAAAAEA